ncbi:porin family protein [Microbulbifer sp. HZ11]|uniref:porin family protein n=1 Tax=Microbulbifer sp. HZ11 TaxID=1453501 RepID=UPI00068FCD0D|nr:porin family protein [Microbulbifer sp. HZ11]
MMKKALAVAAMVCCSATVQAAEGGYWGAVGGLMNVDIDGDNPFNVGVRGGYSWASGWGVEGEVTTSAAKGTFDYDYYYSAREVEYSLTTVALYGTYRSQGDVYFKGKIGFLNENVDVDGYGADDSGLSLGVGAGFNLSENLNLEAEYTIVEEDVGFFSGSLVFRF